MRSRVGRRGSRRGRFRLSLALVAVPAMLLAPAGAEGDRNPTAAVESFLRAEMERNHIPGLAVAVVRDGKTLLLKGFGTASLEWDAAVTPDTAFQLASATKPLTGTALALLAQQGRIALDDRVSKHLPDAPAAWRDITVRRLADHSAGLPENLGPEAVTSAGEAVKHLAKQPLAHEPGERAGYGFSSYVVLQHLLETLTGKAFPTFLSETLLDPLAMRSARFDRPVELGPVRVSDVIRRRAGMYRWDDGAQKAAAVTYGPHAYTAGGLHASASDLAKWAAALDRGKLLAPSSLEAMWTRPKLKDGSEGSYGTGWLVRTYRGRRVAGHSGGPALADILRFVDEKLTIVVLTNQQRLYPYLAEGVADLYFPPAESQAAALVDREPETTAALRRLVADLARRKVDPEQFAPAARRGIVPFLQSGEFSAYLSSLAPLRSFDLIERREVGELRFRRYRALYGAKPIVWSFHLTPEGKVASMQPTPE